MSLLCQSVDTTSKTLFGSIMGVTMCQYYKRPKGPKMRLLVWSLSIQCRVVQLWLLVKQLENLLFKYFVLLLCTLHTLYMKTDSILIQLASWILQLSCRGACGR